MANPYKYGEFQIGDTSLYDFSDKSRLVNMYITYMLARTQKMFKYNNLPDSIPRRNLELYLQTSGHCCFTKVDDILYVFIGGLGGEPDAYYMPTKYIVANPALKFSKTLEIGKDCVVITNDSMYYGLLPMFSKYATQLVENDISMNLVDINSRVQSLLSAKDDRTRASAEKYIADVFDGKLGVVADSILFDENLKVSPYTNTANNQLTNLIEYHQYLKASWFNDLGLQSNYNMKRESINSNEAQLNEDALLPLVDDMLMCRQQALEKVNEMFGTNISVELDSSWEDNEIELELEHKALDEESSENTDYEDVKEETGVSENEEVTPEPEDEPKDEDKNEKDDDSSVAEELVDVLEEVLKKDEKPDEETE